jgi:hypothetical protein
LHADYFGPGRGDPSSPVRLEVIDRATHDALQRLLDAGLIARATRASRPIWPPETAGALPPPLSAAELEKAAAHRQIAGRKLKIARVLSDAGLFEEARNALLEGLLPLSRAFGIEARLPEPGGLKEAFLPPFCDCWKTALPLLREFVADATRPCQPLLEALVPFVPAS